MFNWLGLEYCPHCGDPFFDGICDMCDYCEDDDLFEEDDWADNW